MNRTNIYLTDDQVERLDERARQAGVSRAEVIRRVLDRALDGPADHRDADLSAIAASFGAVRVDDWSPDRADGARGAHLDRVRSR